MAIIRVGKAMPEWAWFEDPYDQDSLKLDVKKQGRAVYEDSAGAQIVLIGSNISYKGDRIVGGKVTEVYFLDKHGGTLITVKGGNYNADPLTDGLENSVSLWAFMSALTAGDDRIYGGTKGVDLNFGDNRGDDLIVAGSGGTNIEGSKGNDTMRGGAGWDSLSFQDTYWRGDDKQGIKLDAAAGTIIDSWGDKDKFDNRFEEFRGSVYADIMKGSSRNEAFMGMKGKDIIDGGKGWDEVRYHRDEHYDGKKGIVADLARGRITDGFGNIDTVKNIEAVYGTYKADSFIGDDHNNQFRGLSGVDSFNGGKGKDEVSFSWWEDLGQHGVNVDLTRSTNQIQDDGFGNRETVKSIEALSGGEFADKLQLGSHGGWARGGGGNDILTGGAAGDSLGGDDGNDTFVFVSAAKIGTLAGAHSRIEDFEQGNDKVDLTAIGGLSFIGTDGFSHTAGELRYEQSGGSTFLLGDTDGDGSADFALQLVGTFTIAGADLSL